MAFLPINKKEMDALGWDSPDFVFVFGDAYVDHPSFGHAIISRMLESAGYRVAMMPLPKYKDINSFKEFGRPRLGFLVSAGNMDSMVNGYTAAKKPRSKDSYAPGGKAGLRPNRASIVYSNKIREIYPDAPIILGGVEASLRRFAHYDYWDNKVRRSVLEDSGGDLLIYGMGESAIVQIANLLDKGVPITSIRGIPGTCQIVDSPPENAILLADFNTINTDKKEYAKTFMIQYKNQDPYSGKPLCQKQHRKFVLQNIPAKPVEQKQFDAIYELPYERDYHPSYDSVGGVPAVSEVQFSLTSSRGCYGGCSFCALTFHQGRIVSGRSHASLIREAKILTKHPKFTGYIHDVGGPTANFREPACSRQNKIGSCPHKQCMYPELCETIKPSHNDYTILLKKLRALPGVKKVFVRSGLRYDYIMADENRAGFMRELIDHHVSGQLKVAPEHVSDKVLQAMGKPDFEVFRRFAQSYENMNRKSGKDQYMVQYFMSSHPGSDLPAAIELAEAMRDMNISPEQVQDFYPTPGVLSTCMYYTGLDPRNMKPIHVPKGEEKTMQRALLQYRSPKNHAKVRKALIICNRFDLIGNGKKCLVPEENERHLTAGRPRKKRATAGKRRRRK